MKVSQIETPALILENGVFQANRRVMAQLMKQSGIALRPHYSTHRCAAIARSQLVDGAIGFSCAALAEAEALADFGAESIVIANQIVQENMLARLAELAARCCLSVCVDGAENVLALEKAMADRGSMLRCLVEYDLGLRRCGAESHREVVELARLVQRQPHLVFGGIQAYDGHISREPGGGVRQYEVDRIERDLAELKEKLVANGLPPEEIGGISTGTAAAKTGGSVYTAMQCGSYLFMDRSYGDLNLGFENALFLLATVVSAKRDRIVTDCGMESLGAVGEAPVVIGLEQCPIAVGEGYSRVDAPAHGFRVGDKVRCIPGRCGAAIRCHDRIYLVEGEDVLEVWPVASCGDR